MDLQAQVNTQGQDSKETVYIVNKKNKCLKYSMLYLLNVPVKCQTTASTSSNYFDQLPLESNHKYNIKTTFMYLLASCAC